MPKNHGVRFGHLVLVEVGDMRELTRKALRPRSVDVGTGLLGGAYELAQTSWEHLPRLLAGLSELLSVATPGRPGKTRLSAKGLSSSRGCLAVRSQAELLDIQTRETASNFDSAHGDVIRAASLSSPQDGLVSGR